MFRLVAFSVAYVICVPSGPILISRAGGHRMPDDYEQQIQDWRTQSEERLKSPGGWLALVGHHWLKVGENTFGTSPDSDLVLPSDLDGAPAGKFIVDGDHVTLETAQDLGVLVNGEPVTSIELKIDTSEDETDGEDKITIDDRLRLQLVRRSSKFAIRVRDKDCQAIREFTGKKWFSVKPEYRVEAKFTPYEPPKRISIVNVKGQTIESKLTGQLEFELDGKTITLDALADSPDSLFIVFRDATSGKSTYGAARFLVADLPVDGNVVLDFNKAYNPPCAFSLHALCPLPPKQNVLKDVAIEAGELKYEGK